MRRSGTLRPATYRQSISLGQSKEAFGVNGEAVDVFLPYRRTSGGTIEYADLLAVKGKVSVFGSDAGTK